MDKEERIGPLVEVLGEMLWARFPLGERAIRVLVGAVLGLLQNIPHHASAGWEGVELVGFAALEEEEDHLHLAVVDGRVGLRGSLGLNPCFRGVSAQEALELVLVEGVSRFDKPGRGGSLRGIREVTLRQGASSTCARGRARSSRRTWSGNWGRSRSSPGEHSSDLRKERGEAR
ncbi:MAG: hypothetical protein QXT77_01585 [Candidatus Methanomethylicaceae archaeon]